MSSEESDVNENGDEILVVKLPPWRSSGCSRMFNTTGYSRQLLCWRPELKNNNKR